MNESYISSLHFVFIKSTLHLLEYRSVLLEYYLHNCWSMWSEAGQVRLWHAQEQSGPVPIPSTERHETEAGAVAMPLYICRLTNFSSLLIGFTLRSAVRPEPNGNPRWGLKASRTSNGSTCPPHVRTFAVALHETCTSFRFLSCVGIHGGFHLQKLPGMYVPSITSVM